MKGIEMAQTAQLTGTRQLGKVREYSGKALSMLKIGFIGFGGGSALIPVIEDEVVTKQHLLSEKDYNEAVVCACVTPGALPVEIAAGVGHKIDGVRGMLIYSALMALPGALLTVLLLTAMSLFSDQAFSLIRALSLGISAWIMASLVRYGVDTAKKEREHSRRAGWVSLLVMALVFALNGGRSAAALVIGQEAASRIPKFSTLQILLVFFAVILVHERLHASDRKTQHTRISRRAWGSLAGILASFGILLFVSVLPALLLLPNGISLVFRGILSALVSFGGGDAYLTVADGLFVQAGLVDANTFYQLLVPVANVLPGSILTKVLTGIGLTIGEQAGSGAAGAIAGFVISVAVSGMTFGVVYWIFITFREVSVFETISRWIRPVIAGLLLSVVVTMGKTQLQTAAALNLNVLPVLAFTLAVAAINLFLQERKKGGALLPLLSAAASFALVALI